MNLSTNIDFDVKHFFRWWGRELSYWVPEKIRQALSDKSGYLFFTVTEKTLQLYSIRNGEKIPVYEVELNDSKKQILQEYLDNNEPLKKASYILRLSSAQAIQKIVYLPAAAKENLEQVITFEMDRYTPFTIDQVYFAVKQLEKEENGQIKVLLVITPKEKLDYIYQQIQTLNVYPVAVDYELAANDYEEDLEPYNLLPESNRPEKNKITQYSTWLASLFLVLLSAAVLIFPIWHQQRAVESIKKQLKTVMKESTVVQSKQLEIDAMVDETQRLIAVKKESASAIDLLDTLTQLLPDNTWLTHLKYNHSKVQIRGQSPAASALISVLDNSPLLSNVRFVSPLTQDKKTGLERFQISVEVVPKESSDDK